MDFSRILKEKKQMDWDFQKKERKKNRADAGSR